MIGDQGRIIDDNTSLVRKAERGHENGRARGTYTVVALLLSSLLSEFESFWKVSHTLFSFSLSTPIFFFLLLTALNLPFVESKKEQTEIIVKAAEFSFFVLNSISEQNV